MNSPEENRIRLALQNEPVSLEELSREMGDSWKSRELILEGLDREIIQLIPIGYDYFVITSLVMIILVEFFPNNLRPVPALLTIIILPYIWNIQLVSILEIHRSYAVGIQIIELMVIGLFLGYLDSLTRVNITISLTILIITKWIILSYLRYENPSYNG